MQNIGLKKRLHSLLPRMGKGLVFLVSCAFIIAVTLALFKTVGPENAFAASYKILNIGGVIRPPLMIAFLILLRPIAKMLEANNRISPDLSYLLQRTHLRILFLYIILEIIVGQSLSPIYGIPILLIVVALKYGTRKFFDRGAKQ